LKTQGKSTMFITDLSIKRPIFSIALSLIIIIIGVLSYRNLNLQQYPDAEEQVLIVDTKYPGAAASIIESKVTTPLESSLAGIPGLDYMESSSKTGQSHITLYFHPKTSLSDVASDVREHIAQITDTLPQGSKEPIVIKSSESKEPFMYVTLTSSIHSEGELYDYADRYLKDQLESIPGVADATIYGNPLTMKASLDREKMKAYNISVTDIIDALEGSSQAFPGGQIVKGKRYVNLIVDSGLNTPQELEKLVISGERDHIISLKDIATVSFDRDTRDDEWLPRYNKKPAVFIGVKKRSDGNVLSISAAVQEILAKNASSHPQGMVVEDGYNISLFIKASLKAVQRAILESIILVLLIIFLFLHSPRATLIPLMTIPISLIGSFAFLYLFHCSINTITLLAMVLAIGLVVDDAIVVLENIHRHIEEGLKPFEAAIKGSREVGFAVIAMTLTLASVYAPIAFIQGLTGKLFSEFAISLAGAVLISGVVALTLSPMMCSRLLPPKTKLKSNAFSDFIETIMNVLAHGYQASLKNLLMRPKLFLVGFSGVLLLGLFLFYKIPSELAPQEDESLIQAWVQGPDGATIDSLIPYTIQIEDLLSSVPEHNNLWSDTQRTGIFAGIQLKPWSQRSRSQQEIIDSLRKVGRKTPGVKVSIFPKKTLLTGGQASVEVAINTTGSYEFLETEVEKLIASLKKSTCFESMEQTLSLGIPQLNIQVDRNKAALLGVKIKDAARALEVMLSGAAVSTFQKEGKIYDIILQSTERNKRSIEDIGNFYVNALHEDKKLEPVPLGNLITIKEIATPADLTHINKMRSSTLTADLAPSCNLSEAMSLVKTTMKEELSPSLQTEPIGKLRKFLESKADMYIIFLTSLLFIYLVLAIQFDSLIDPLLIMVTVPLSMMGALVALYFTGGTLNIFSQVGLITLVGLITKHGILIVDFANKQRHQGLSVVEAIQKATRLRFRPILMTTGAMVLGSIPLALATGAGAESRQQIGWVLVGGLLGGTLFTLYAVPFAYRLVKGKHE